MNKKWTVLWMCLLTVSGASALDSVETLPKGVHSPSIRRGLIRNIGERYSSNGELQLISDRNSVELNQQTLSGYVGSEQRQRIDTLVSVLNSFTGGAADDLSLGYFRVETTPEIDYWAPIYAVGITNNVSLGIGLPVIEYRNTIQLQTFGSNAGDFLALRGIDPEIQQGLEQLVHTNVKSTVSSVIAKKGFKPLKSVQESFVGDAQLVAMTKFKMDKRTTVLSRSTLILPTGPKDDPNDLTDLDIFGETAIDQNILAARNVGGGVTAFLNTGVRLYLPDSIEKRVPESETDSLPDQDTIESLDRLIGPRLSFGGSANYAFNDSFVLGGGLDQMFKAGDSYRGSKEARYDLLETDTGKAATIVKLGASYSTVASYHSGKIMAPFIISFNFSDVVAGRNIERQTLNELWFTMFF